MQEHLRRVLILDQENIGMEFNEGVIIKGKVMNGNQVLMSGWNVENIV
jgi:hypothetical protein